MVRCHDLVGSRWLPRHARYSTRSNALADLILLLLAEVMEARSWRLLPEDARRWVSARLGEPLAFEPAEGGSAEVAVIARTCDDTYFLKAARVDSPCAGDLRIEARVAGWRGAADAERTHVLSPHLRLYGECGGWVVLCFDVAPGKQPGEPWDERELRVVLATMDRLAADPQHSPSAELPSVCDRMRGRCSTWRQLQAHGRRDRVTLVELGEWERSALPRLAAVEGRWEELVRGSSLVHFDPRHDNLRITHDQQVWFLDWGRACLGPAWVDPVCLLLESSIGDLDADELFLSTELGAAADPAAVDAFLVVLASYWRHIALQPADAAEEWIRRRQQRSGDATIRWLRKRWS